MESFNVFAISDRLNQAILTACEKFDKISGPEWQYKPSPEKWSKKEILGHLLDSAANNHLRFVRAQLAENEFVSFAYEQDFFVSSQDYQNQDIQNLLNLWVSYNTHLACIIKKADPGKLNVICRIGKYEPVTLGYIMNDYVDHLNHHLSDIYR